MCQSKKHHNFSTNVLCRLHYIHKSVNEVPLKSEYCVNVHTYVCVYVHVHMQPLNTINVL